MAATKGKLTEPQKQNIRDRIQTTQLVKRLQFYALEEKDEAGNDVEIDAGRMRAIEILLKKSLPDLSAITIGNKEGETFKHEDTGQGATKLTALLDTIAERSAASSSPDAE